MSAIHHLSRPALLDLATGLEAGRLSPPLDVVSLTGYVPSTLRQGVLLELQKMLHMEMTTNHIGYALRMLAEERLSAQMNHDRVDLVWTGDKFPGSESRDTSVVVKSLFDSAKSSVLISTYALDNGRKGQDLFQPLVDRMEAYPDLHVRIFLNIKRPYRCELSDAMLLREFAEDFRNKLWIGRRLPEVFYDPRSLSKEGGDKSCLHAKCVVIDEETLFVTSANFTEAAHERNIEAGVLLKDPVAARVMRSQFEVLVTKGRLCRVPGL